MPSSDDPNPGVPPEATPAERLQELARRVGPSITRSHALRPWAVFGLVLLFMGGMSVAAFQWTLKALLHSRGEVVMPDLKGKTLEQSLDVLFPLNISLVKEGVEFNESLPPGAVIKQSPPAGIKVREGKAARVVLSGGGQVVFVPGLAGKPLAEAQNDLRAAGLAPGALTQVHSQVYENGWIVEQSPQAGSVLTPGGMVDLKVSKGPPPQGTLLMRDFVNRPLSQAKQWVEENRLKAEVGEETTEDVLPGVVLSQRPLPDAPVDPEGTVSFVVSKSSQPLAGMRTIRYEVPAGSGRVLVRIVMRDEREEREIFQGHQDAGALVEVPVRPRGLARARIFVNGVLIEERVIE